MKRQKLDPGTPLTESEARQILACAAGIDANISHTSLSELRRAAIEAGISASSLADAEQQVLAARQSVVPPAMRPTWARAIFAAAAGAISGGSARVLADLVEPNLIIDVPFTIGLMLASLWMATSAGSHGKKLGTLARIAGLWTGFVAGWAAVAQRVTEDLVFGLGGLGLATALVAAALMSTVRSQPDVTDKPE